MSSTPRAANGTTIAGIGSEEEEWGAAVEAGEVEDGAAFEVAVADKELDDILARKILWLEVSVYLDQIMKEGEEEEGKICFPFVQRVNKVNGTKAERRSLPSTPSKIESYQIFIL